MIVVNIDATEIEEISNQLDILGVLRPKISAAQSTGSVSVPTTSMSAEESSHLPASADA